MLIRGLTVKGIEVRSTSSAISSDEYFNLVSLLLPGTGTNGAQNNTFVDSSTNNFTVTRAGNTTQGTFSPFSQTGWSGYFDGSGDSISAPDNAALEFGSGDFTIEASVYLTAYSSSYSGFYGTYVVAKDSNGARSYAFYITSTVSSFTGIGLVTFDGSGNANLNFAASASLNLNTWYHIAVSRSGTTFRLFLDGSLIGSTTSAVSILDTAIPTRIGAGAYSGFEYYLTGYISNVRIVKGTAVYTSAFTPPSAPLTAISGTSLLTCQSNRFVDNSTNAFAITVAGNTSVQAFSPFNPTAAYSAATVGGSGYFDGTGDYLTTASSTNLALGSGDFTVEMWVYPSNTSAVYRALVASDAYAGVTNGWTVYQNGTNIEMYYASSGGGATPNIFTATSALVASTWQHVAISRSSSTLKAFVNGVQVASVSNSINFAGNIIYIGDNNAGDYFFNGYISNVRIVKGTAVYTSAFTPPTAPVTAIANTQLLLNYTNGGITDATAKNVLETVGGAAISTAQSKFGGSSMYFDGNLPSDYLLLPSSQNLVMGTGDFTIECWLNISATGSSDGVIIELRSSGATATGFVFNTRGSGGGYVLNFYTDGAPNLGSTVLSFNVWNHVAVTRSSGSVRLFANGVVDATFTKNNNFSEAPSVTIGQSLLYVNSQLTGYIDDLRITKGYARYTTTFTPPTQAFPTQ